MNDSIEINFNPESQTLLHLLLAFIMFGVALDLNITDLRNAFRRPRPTLVGMLAQFILLPAMTFALLAVWRPDAGLALGLLLVAACPGGNISNFISAMARADVALSVSLTTVSTLLCVFLTPFNFGLWARWLPDVQGLLRNVHLDATDLVSSMLLLLVLPVVAGMIVNVRCPVLSDHIRVPIRKLSMVLFLGLVVVALWSNRAGFVLYLNKVFLLVLAHNLIALRLGYYTGKVFTLNAQQCRTLSIETGIQNAGLGLVICLSFFPEIGEMALVCAWWGVWHIVSGMTIGSIWSRMT